MELKKNPNADLEKKRGIFFQVGLVVALAGVLIAFEWKSYESKNIDLGTLKVDMSEEEIIPITQQAAAPPPPPPAVTVEINIVEDNKKVEEVEIQSTEATVETVVQEVIEQKEEVIEAPEIFTIVEDMPKFPGGEAKLFEYIQNSLKYPQMAKESGIQGKVYVTFVIGPDGKVKDVKILRGIKGGCDEEAIRVVQNMPAWSPGKQRGKAVSVQYNLPINFVLR